MRCGTPLALHDLRGDEEIFQAVMDDDQPSVSMLRQGNSEYVPRPPLKFWPVIVAGILGSIVIGPVLVMILWKCINYIGVSLAF